MKYSIFYNFFPVPKIIDMEGVGVDITDNAVRFMRLVPHEGGFIPKEFGEYPLPTGAFSQGKILNAGPIQEVLSKIKKEYGVKFAHTSLPETQTYLVEMSIASVKKSELRESIELQIEEYIPLKVTEAVFDYHVLDSSKKEQGKTTVVVSVAPRDVVNSYMELFNSAEIPLFSLETEAQAIARVVVSKLEPETVMVVHLGISKTGVFIVQQGLVRLVSDIEIGRNDVVSALEKGLNISKEQVIQLMSDKFVSKEIHQEKILEILSPIFAELSDEAGKHLLYWQSRKEKSPTTKEKVHKIVITGPGADVLGLAGYLSTNLRLQTELADVWQNVISFEHYIPQISFEDSLKYTTAIGLAMSFKDR